MNKTEPASRVQWLEFHGQKVLFLNFRSATVEESLKLIADFTKIADAQPDHSMDLLTDVTDANYDAMIANKWKAARFAQDAKIRRSAVFGLKGLVGIAVRAFQQAAEMLGKRRVKIFADQEGAVRWLTNPENKA